MNLSIPCTDSPFSSIELITASVIQGLLMVFLIVDFGIANLHDLSIALVKVSKNMLKSGCSKLYEPMRLS